MGSGRSIRAPAIHCFGGGFFFAGAGAAGLGGGATGASCANTGLGANFGSDTPICPGWIFTETVSGAKPCCENVTVNGASAVTSSEHGVRQVAPSETAACAPWCRRCHGARIPV